MSNSEMSPFGKAIFEAFGEIAKTQAQIAKANHALVQAVESVVEDNRRQELSFRPMNLGNGDDYRELIRKRDEFKESQSGEVAQNPED